MNVLKAYADAGALAGRPAAYAAASRSGSAAARKQGGDFLSLSETARQMLEADSRTPVSGTPQDATYDQNGQVTRQLDSLQGDLRSLAAQFINQPELAGMAGRVDSMRSRVSSIRAMV